MSNVESMSSAVAEPFRTARRNHHTTANGALSCMVVSDNSELCDLLQDAAGRVGWKVDLFADATTAKKAARRSRFRLALIDVSQGSPSLSHVGHDLCCSFAKQKGNLLVVCGQEGDPEIEIWARSVGAWVHLAGPGNLSGLTTIFREAAQLMSRWIDVKKAPSPV